ncbi:HD domain-containing phosphohydrolase [Thalassomonas sp. RHCl1]|uniref:HD domain-containing phosphohydrolase n=1 Tax=Thalassomonas sp. RHCl1 TaxID=2995320 RepID=UPI00248C0D26|nr:HD domain-containing phosphohydrolase [Thalassomonas sp. RHCl1]
MNNVELFTEIGIALSTEKDHRLLLEKILLNAIILTHADGGTIYSVTAEHALKFETIINKSLKLHLGGTTEHKITFADIPIYINDKVNTKAMVAVAAATGEIINIKDAYHDKHYDTSAARQMDSQTGYRTQSVLTLPMKDHLGELNGVLQLLNATSESGEVVPFNQENQLQVRALTSLAAVVLTNKQLIDDMETLFTTFSKLIAEAIDKKSPYTGGHCRRVPEITLLLARACHETDSGPLKDFTLTLEDFHEISVAAWLHDCGKVATPAHIMDKATKLEGIFDRIALVDARFEIARRDLEHHPELSPVSRRQKLTQLESDREFIRQANIGSEFFNQEKVDRVHQISQHYQVIIAGEKQAILSDNEVHHLITQRGTLTAQERQIINEHMDITVEMLESTKFPKHLQNVPEYACGHHEKMDGSGYPKGLTRDQMSVPARMMAIADIFEALTAADRPYKVAKTLSESLTILGRMKLDHHIDPDIFDVFIDKQVYLDFARSALKAEQIDDFDVNNIPGYVPPAQRKDLAEAIKTHKEG